MKAAKIYSLILSKLNAQHWQYTSSLSHSATKTQHTDRVGCRNSATELCFKTCMKNIHLKCLLLLYIHTLLQDGCPQHVELTSAPSAMDYFLEVRFVMR